MSDVSYYNSERYPDPTAYAGLTAAIKAEKAMHFKRLWCISVRLTRATPG